jgi:preprotein translocase subunit SecD
MNQFSRWKNTLILLTVIFAVFYALPNFFGESPAVQIMPIKSGEKNGSNHCITVRKNTRRK